MLKSKTGYNDVFIYKAGYRKTEYYVATNTIPTTGAVVADNLIAELRPATDEEKQKLFDAMAKEGMRWNAEKKVVEDIPKPYEFKKGEPVLVRDGDKEIWRLRVYIGSIEDSKYTTYLVKSEVIDSKYRYCIPYNEKTMHLLGDNGGLQGGRMMKTETPILDACCGGKMFYFDKHDSRVLFQDIRDVETTLCDGRPFEVKPDVQADFTNMPYPDESFSMVVFDPPHLVYSRGKKSKMADMYGILSDKTVPTGYQHIKYGALYSDWRDMLSKGFAECFRVLKPGGFLIFKWNETDIKVSEILKLTDQKPVFGNRCGKAAKTHWICFMKDYKEGQL